MSGAQQPASRVRIVSGLRPTGPLHLGHYAGLLRPWLGFEAEGECFLLVADLQALGTQPELAGRIPGFVQAAVLDCLAAGVDPGVTRFVLQSQVPELAELTAYLQPFARAGELRRNPALRAEARRLRHEDPAGSLERIELGLLAYPVSQVADILLFSPPDRSPGGRLVVPVTADQIPLIEYAAELAGRFHARCGRVFTPPEARATPGLPGTDGGFKMGKTPRNAIFLTEDDAELERKVGAMFTDPLRERPEDPGHPDACPCFALRGVFGGPDLEERRRACRAAETDCTECRRELLRELRAFLAPFQARRAELARRKGLVRDVLVEGTRRAREAGAVTLAAVREALHLGFPDAEDG